MRLYAIIIIYWLSNFKKRKHITELYESGEAASVPLNDLSKFIAELKSIIAQYNLHDG